MEHLVTCCYYVTPAVSGVNTEHWTMWPGRITPSHTSLLLLIGFRNPTSASNCIQKHKKTLPSSNCYLYVTNINDPATNANWKQFQLIMQRNIWESLYLHLEYEIVLAFSQVTQVATWCSSMSWPSQSKSCLHFPLKFIQNSKNWCRVQKVILVLFLQSENLIVDKVFISSSWTFGIYSL